MESQALPSLRPLRLGELLDRAIRLYRANFLTFIGIIAVVYVPLMVLQTALSAFFGSSVPNNFSGNSAMNYASVVALLSIFALLLVQIVLVQGITTGALTRAVADHYLGKKTSILEAYRGIGKSWLTLLLALLFVYVIAFFLGIWWVIVPCLGWFTGLGMVFFWMTAVNPLVAPVIVLEAPGPWSSPQDNLFERLGNWILRAVFAIRRAWSLARRRFWPLLGSVFVLYLFSLLIVNGPQAIVNILLTQFSESFGDSTTQVVIASIIQGLVSIVFVLIYYPLQMAAFTLIYFDLRVRTEGFDLALLAMESSSPADISEVMTVPAPEVQEPFMTWPEMANFAILTLASLGLYILFSAVLLGILLLSSSLLS